MNDGAGGGDGASPHGPEAATRIVAIRHGETDWNAGARIQGHTDIALNRTGRWQASQLAQALTDEAVQAVYASDLARAWATAEAVAQRLGVPLVAETGLRERGFGRFEGATFDQIERRWPEDALRWRQRDLDFAPGGGEALTGFYARCIEAVERLARMHRGQALVLVAHGGVLDCLYRAANRLPLEAPRHWRLANTAINRLLHTDQGFTLLTWDDARHLEDEMPGDEPLS